jgi:hypothetical protein
MLKQDILSLITRMIPEAFLMIYSIYILTKSKVDMKKILISSIIGGIGIYLIRFLPIHFGIHTILSIMLYILLAVKLNKMDIYKAITMTLVSIIILFISDFLFVIIYTKIFQFSSEVLFGGGWVSNITGIPSLLLLYLVIWIIAYFKKKKENHV